MIFHASATYFADTYSIKNVLLVFTGFWLGQFCALLQAGTGVMWLQMYKSDVKHKQTDAESYEKGLIVTKISWPEMKSTKAIFGDKHYPNKSVRDTLHICYFNITIS